MRRTVALSGVAAFALVGDLACRPAVCRDLVFPPADESPYLLPYPEGASYRVSQSYCTRRAGHRGRIAIDFRMPQGSVVTAARGGEVVEVENGFADGDFTRGHNNRVLVRHDDRSVAWYAHLEEGSVEVEVGDRVEAGRPIARSGNSGNTGGQPHLHFEVFRTTIYDYSDAVPVSFRNARGPLDERGGPVAGARYEAAETGNAIRGPAPTNVDGALR